MQLKLNIYNKRNIEKTYTAETYDIMFGTVEDLLNLIDLDKLNGKNDIEFIQAAVDVVINGIGIIKPLLQDIFEGLTDDELRNTKVSEVASVLVTIIKFTISQISKGNTEKN